MSKSALQASTVNEQKKTGVGGRFGFLSHKPSDTTLDAPTFTALEDLPPLMVEVRLQQAEHDEFFDRETIEFDARTLIAGRTEEEIAELIDDTYDGLEGDWLYEEARKQGIAQDWKGPYECDTRSLFEKFDEDPQLTELFGQANLNPESNFTAVDGQLVDRNEWIRNGRMDADGTIWEINDQGELSSTAEGSKMVITLDETTFPGEKVHNYEVSDNHGSYISEFKISLEDAKSNAKRAIAEAKNAGTPTNMVGMVHQVHGAVETQSRLIPGVDQFAMADGANGLKFSSAMTRRLPEAMQRADGVYVGDEAAHMREELGRVDATGAEIYTFFLLDL